MNTPNRRGFFQALAAAIAGGGGAVGAAKPPKELVVPKGNTLKVINVTPPLQSSANTFTYYGGATVPTIKPCHLAWRVCVFAQSQSNLLQGNRLQDGR